MATTSYKNPWFNPKNRHCGPEFYSTDVKPEEYKGYLIFHRINSTSPISSGAHVFDIVKDGRCISQFAGPNGAKARIDKLTIGGK